MLRFASCYMDDLNAVSAMKTSAEGTVGLLPGP